MDSFPPEFVSHLHPLVFVAGLPDPNVSNTYANTTDPDDQPENPQVNDNDDSDISTPNNLHALGLALRDSLVKGSSIHIWDVSRGVKPDLRILPVAIDVKFPPSKAQSSGTSSSAHSPLSPLSPSSPLYPDGLIPPIWVRKHRDLLPSVFLLVLRLPQANYDPLTQTPPTCDEQIISSILNRKLLTDEKGIKLAVVLLTTNSTINDNSNSLDARLSNIRRLAGLDSRASLFILSPVETSELNSFVSSLRVQLHEAAVDYYRERARRARRKRSRIPPNPSSRLIRQPSLSTSNNNAPTLSNSHPLSPLGWAVRYDYKIAVHSEFRQEFPVALKHYEDAYNGTLGLFASTALLQPRTKRWAEARVLIDSLSLKICKLHLYNNDHSRVMAQHNHHIRKFRELSSGWGLGDETFEFWSWLTKQYRSLADLMDIALRAGLRLPPPQYLVDALPSNRRPHLTNSAQSATSNPSLTLQHPGFYYFIAATCAFERYARFKQSLINEEDMRKNLPKEELENYTPSPALSFEKKFNHGTLIIDLYTKAYEAFKKFPSTSRTSLNIAARIFSSHIDNKDYKTALKFQERLAHGYRKENWCDILAAILHCSLESMKTLIISDVNQEAEKEHTEEAAENDEGHIDVNQTITSLVTTLLEYLSVRMSVTLHSKIDPVQLWKDTCDKIPKAESPNDKAHSIDMDSSSLLDIKNTFWTNDASTVNYRVPFQLSFAAPPQFPLESIYFSKLSIYFNSWDTEKRIDIVQDSSLNTTSDPNFKSAEQRFEKINLGDINQDSKLDPFKVDSLRWMPNHTKFFVGTISSNTATKAKISRVVFFLDIKDHQFELTCTVPSTIQTHDPKQQGLLNSSQWITGNSPDSYNLIPISQQYESCSFDQRKLKLEPFWEIESPAYIYEPFPIRVCLTNNDTVPIEASFDVLLQPSDNEDTFDDISIDDISSKTFLEDINLGSIEPGGTKSRILYLTNRGAIGTRNIDISYRAIPLATNEDKSSKNLAHPCHTEILKAVSIPVVYPIRCTFQQSASLNMSKGTITQNDEMQDNKDKKSGALESKPWNESIIVNVHSSLECCGKWPVTITLVNLDISHATSPVQLIGCSLQEEDGQLPSTWNENEALGVVYTLKVTPPNDSSTHTINGSTLQVTWVRGNTRDAKQSTIYIPFPPLEIPSYILHGGSVIADIPTMVKQHELVEFCYTIRNGFSSYNNTNKSTSSSSAASSLMVTVEMESNENWVFSGPRKLNNVFIGQGESVDFVIKACAVSWLGVIPAPKCRAICRLPKGTGTLPSSSSSPNGNNAFDNTSSSLSRSSSLSSAFSSNRMSRRPDLAETASIASSGRFSVDGENNNSREGGAYYEEFEYRELPVIRKGTIWHPTPIVEGFDNTDIFVYVVK